MQTTTYTVEQVSKILGVRKGFVYDLIYTGRLRAIRLSQRRFRITQLALNDFIMQEEEKVAAQKISYTDLCLSKEAK